MKICSYKFFKTDFQVRVRTGTVDQRPKSQVSITYKSSRPVSVVTVLAVNSESNSRVISRVNSIVFAKWCVGDIVGDPELLTASESFSSNASSELFSCRLSETSHAAIVVKGT